MQLNDEKNQHDHDQIDLPERTYLDNFDGLICTKELIIGIKLNFFLIFQKVWLIVISEILVIFAQNNIL